MGKTWLRIYRGNSASIIPDWDEPELARAGSCTPCWALQRRREKKKHFSDTLHYATGHRHIQLSSFCPTATSNKWMPNIMTSVNPCVMCSSQNICSRSSLHRKFSFMESMWFLSAFLFYRSAWFSRRGHLSPFGSHPAACPYKCSCCRGTHECSHLILEHGLRALVGSSPPKYTWPVWKVLSEPLNFSAHRPIPTHEFWSASLCSSFAKATVTTVVRRVMENQDEEHCGHTLPSMSSSHDQKHGGRHPIRPTC